MNKKLIALALAGASALPVAAQAQTANVTLYGRVNLDMEFVRGRQADGSNPWTYRVSSNSSRFGLRGVESLGGGLNAIFQIENGSIAMDASGGALAGRESFVGLQGAWGTVKLGRFLAPYDDLHPIFGSVPTYITGILGTGALWAQAGAPNQQAGGNFDDRVANSVRYDSPTMGGFNGSIQYGAAESVVAGQRHGGTVSLAGFYNNGPIQVGAAYERHIKLRIPNKDDDAWSIAGAYNFGVVKVGAVYERLKYETLTGDLKRDFWGVSATANLGPGQLYAFYGDASKGKGGAADGTRVAFLAKGADTDSEQWEVSYTYPLSKRTITYAGYVKINNSANANYTFHVNGYTVANGGKPEGFTVGMAHNF